NSVDYGLTREGLIREGSRHVKDDRFRVNDRAKYVLGWSTRSKLAALAEEFAAAEKRLNEAKKKFEHADEQAKVYDNRLSAVTAVLQVENFEEINAQPEQELLARLKTEKERLESSSDRVKELKKQLAKAGERITEKNSQIQDADNRIGDEKGK